MSESSQKEASKECIQRRNIEDSSGGSRRIGRYLFIYGFTDQYAIQGQFSGRQCTSTALAALIFWGYRGRPYMFTPENVNEILIEGYILHSRLRCINTADPEINFLRLEFNVSSSSDGMVAIYELPYLQYLELGEVWGMPVKIRLAQEAYLAFTSRRRDLDFPTLGEFLATFMPGESMPFLVTFECYSYGIIRFRNNSIAVFDSHGHLRVRGCNLGQTAGFLLCPNIYAMEQLFTGMYGAFAQCDIAPVDLGLPNDSVKRLQEPDGAETDSPYISMMGGRGD